MRITWIKLHLIIASFFSIVLLCMAISGGGYLLGFQGETEKTSISSEGKTLDFQSENLEADVRQLLADLNIDHDFDYLRAGSTSAMTRPTSRTYYEFRITDGGLEINKHVPNLQKVLVELHKGHGPEIFRVFEQIMAVGLVFILLTGLWLGITSKGLRKQTAVASILGLVVFLGLALFA